MRNSLLALVCLLAFKSHGAVVCNFDGTLEEQAVMGKSLLLLERNLYDATLLIGDQKVDLANPQVSLDRFRGISATSSPQSEYTENETVRYYSFAHASSSMNTPLQIVVILRKPNVPAEPGNTFSGDILTLSPLLHSSLLTCVETEASL